MKIERGDSVEDAARKSTRGLRDWAFDVESNPNMPDSEKVRRLTHQACMSCALIAIQPIPFADLFVLTPVQAVFASRIAAVRGVPLSENDAQTWIKEIVAMGGMGFLAQQLGIAAWKIVVPTIGGLFTIPLVYSLTYGIMKVADLYFQKKAGGVRMSDEEIKEQLKKAMKEGKEAAKRDEAEIRKQSNHGSSEKKK